MGIVDFKMKIMERIKIGLNIVKIRVNKEEKKLSVESLDQSTHFHYHGEIGLSPEAIMKLSAEEIGNLVKYQTFLNLKASSTQDPVAFGKMVAKYPTSALTTGASLVTANAAMPALIENPASKIPLMISGDFISKISEAIEKNSNGNNHNYRPMVYWFYGGRVLAGKKSGADQVPADGEISEDS